MVEYSQKLFHLQILDAALEYNDDTALTDGHSGESWTFQRIHNWSLAFANALNNFGANVGDIVMLCVENCPQYVPIFLGSAMLGCPMSAINPDSTQYEMKHSLKVCKPKFLVISADNHHLAKSCLGKCEVIVMNKRSDQMGYDFEELIKENYSDSVPSPNEPLTLDHVLLAPFSSGTTGTPKCVQLTHRNFSAATAILKKALFDELSHDERRVTVGVLPFYHGSGFWALCYCLLEGHHTIVIGHFHPAIMLSCIEEYKIDTLNLVPAIIGHLCRDEIPISRWDISSVRTVLCGSASLGRNLGKKFLAKFPNVKNLIQGYGLTEIVILSHITPLGEPVDDDRYLSSCGKLLPGFEAMILDEESNCLHNEPWKRGELLLRSPTVMKGYLGDTEADQMVIDKNGWLHTGDIVYLDSSGYYFVIDRIKDLIKVNGMQISPAELEDILKEHDNVHDAAVIGIHDDRYGQVPKAFVVLSRKEEKSDTIAIGKAILKFVHDRVSVHKQLRGGLIVVSDLPRTANGKISRHQLLHSHNGNQKQKQNNQIDV